MIKKSVVLVVLTAVLIMICSCHKTQKNDLMFYVINRESIQSNMSNSEIVSTVKAKGRLAFNGNDIEAYNWQNHVVKLYEEAVPSLGNVTNESGGSSIFKTDDTYAFVLIIKDTLIYVGGFKQGIKNPNPPLQPSIHDNERYSFCIEFDKKYSEHEDNRSNSTLYSFLNKHGLLSTKSY